MNKLYETHNVWIWSKDNITYEAMLYRNVYHRMTFVVRVNGGIILRIKNVTIDSQKKIIERMKIIKKTGVMEFG